MTLLIINNNYSKKVSDICLQNEQYFYIEQFYKFQTMPKKLKTCC